MPAIDPAKLIICAGFFSSGSTWVFNGVKALREKSAAGAPFASGYFDNLSLEWLEQSCQAASVVLIKSHRPHDALIEAALAGAPTIVTIRDPRDAVASLMARFDYDANRAIDLMFHSAARLARMARAPKVLVLRYEDAFIASKSAIGRIAGFLGIEADRATVDAIEETLDYASVRSFIAAKFGKGPISGLEARDMFDTETQWHPRHLGDGRVRKYEGLLGPDAIERLKWATPGFWESFGYSI
jgi:hypothetical protein